jgi:hypothetical protein
MKGAAFPITTRIIFGMALVKIEAISGPWRPAAVSLKTRTRERAIAVISSILRMETSIFREDDPSERTYLG